MSRIPALDPASATGPSRHLLETTQAQLGRVPNLYRCMAHAPAALKGYLDFRAALGTGTLSARLREQLALLVAEENACGYCVSAHTFRGGKMGLPPEEIERNRRGAALDPKSEAALRFARAVARTRAPLPDGALDAVRAAGWGDGEIAEIVAHVALNTFSNTFSHVAEPVLDFPKVELLSHA